jgi:hypothetical protein
MMVTIGLSKFIDGSRMIDYNEILITDHREYIIDIYLDDYFDISLDNIDKIDDSRINSRKLTHRTKFIEKIEDLLDQINIE